MLSINKHSNRLLNRVFETVKISGLRMSSSESKFKVFVTRPIPDEAVSLLKANNIELTINNKYGLAKDQLLNSVTNIDALFCTLNDKIDKDVIDAAGASLKVIGTCSVGFDHIDLKLCKERNIPVGFTPGVLTGTFYELF